MSYQIRKTNGSLIVDLSVGVTDNEVTPLTLIGKNVSDFGKIQNENFVKLLENFSNPTEPYNAILGQLWYDNVENQISVKTPNGFQSLGPFAPVTTPAVTDKSTTLATTEFVHNVLPKGSIIMWSGSIASIPAGWALCDGQLVNGAYTPDLRNKFIMGAGSGSGVSKYSPGETGGSSSIIDPPSHTHSYSGATTPNDTSHNHPGITRNSSDHQHAYPGDDQLAFANGVAGWNATSNGGFSYDARSSSGGGGQLWRTTAGGVHSHIVDIKEESNSHNHDFYGETAATGIAAVSVLNPYYALAFIMKTV